MKEPVQLDAFFSYLRVKNTRQNFMYSSEPSNPCPCHLPELWTQSGIALTFGTSPCRSCISHRWRPQWSLEMAWNSYNGPYPQRQPDVICCPVSKSCIFIPSQHSSTKTHPLQPHSWACRSEVLTNPTWLGRISDRNCNGHCIIISSFHLHLWPSNQSKDSLQWQITKCTLDGLGEDF